MKKIILSLYFVNLLAYAGDGVGTRGTGIRSSEKGIGTRGTNKKNKGNLGDQLLVRKSQKLENHMVFANNAQLVQEVLSLFLTSMTESFEIKKSYNSMMLDNFSVWAASNAGKILDLFENTEWLITTQQSELNNTSEVNFIFGENLIEVSLSPSQLNQQTQSGFITDSLVEFFKYSNSPYEDFEIRKAILPFEESFIEMHYHHGHSMGFD